MMSSAWEEGLKLMHNTVSSLLVREMTEADIAAAAAIHQAVFNRQLDSVAWVTCNFRAYPRILCFVAELNGAPVGFIEWIQKSGFRKEVVLELEQLGVSPDYQGQGVGTALIKESLGFVHRILKRQGACIKNIVVTTRTDNHAQRLYRKVLGAAPEAVIQDLYSADEVIMVARNTRGRLDS
jgi:ribosomal protein S18 acetylase RimI-like enzyme